MIPLYIRVCSTTLASADSVLCGGFHCGHITELIGDSAVGEHLVAPPDCGSNLILVEGKTQLLMQVAANCCISHSHGSSDLKVAIFHDNQPVIIRNSDFICSRRLKYCTYTMGISFVPQGAM